jgi:tRNA A-37 threonylcarbamoyl transferase component Bud32
MDSHPRATSSVYSTDSLELDNLLHRLSLDTLQQEKRALTVEVALLRDRVKKYDHALLICRAVEREVSKMHRHAVAHGNTERNIWFANCTAF